MSRWARTRGWLAAGWAFSNCSASSAPWCSTIVSRSDASILVGGTATAHQPATPLTVREEDILVAVADGLTNAEIGEKLNVSLSTVKTHLGRIQAKLGARNRVEVATWAWRTGRLR